jgi:hypothetical protein
MAAVQKLIDEYSEAIRLYEAAMPHASGASLENFRWHRDLNQRIVADLHRFV